MTRDPGTIARNLATRIAKDRIAEPLSPTTPRRPPAETLGRHLLETVMTTAQARRFRHEPGLRVVIEAPTPAWVEPLLAAAAAMAAWHVAVGADGSPNRSDERVAQALGAGHRIVAVSHAPGRHLPPSLVARADMTVRTGHPTPTVIRKAVRDATGFEPETTSGRLGDRLDFFDLVGAIDAGGDVRTCVRRLRSATANRAVVDRFPASEADLASLHGYGDAAPFARRLVADIEAWRLGENPDVSWPGGRTVLVGPHGTGKRSLVACIARSAGLPSVVTSVDSWFATETSFPEGGPCRAQAAFAQAMGAAPAILLLDGIDAIPKADPHRAHETHHREAIVRFLDAIASGEPASPRLVVVATARFADELDPLLVGPGRLARIIEIPPLDEEAIPDILRQHLGSDLRGMDLGGIVTPAIGSTGATTAGWVRGARRQARIARRDMTVGDLVEKASAPENRSPGSLLRASVHEGFRPVEIPATRSIPIRPSPGRTGVGPAERLRIPAPPAKAASSSLASKARIVSVLAGRALGTKTGAQERAGVHRPGKGK